MKQLSTIALVVPDYDEAIDWYTGVLGFILLENTQLGQGKRWVRVAADRSAQTALLLAKAANDKQQKIIGQQAGGRVFLFLQTDDCLRDYHLMQQRGVHFVEQPRHEDYGIVVVFEDCFGNRWDLVEYCTVGENTASVITR